MPRTHAGLLLALALLLPLPIQAQSHGQVPYAALHERFRPAIVLEQYPRLRGVQRVGSRLPEVAVGDIRIWIQSAGGRIEVPIDANGRADFPLSDALLAENPQVHSNQPQGSLQLQLSLEVDLPGSDPWPYSEVWAAIEEAQAALGSLGSDYSSGEVVGLEYHFTDGPMQVQLEGANLALDLHADQQGRVMLRREREWLERGVQLRFKGRLRSVVPRLR